MGYRVLIMPPAEHRLDMYIGYTALQLKNRQAAKSIIDDARLSKKKLSEVAGTIKVCDNPVLAKYGYRKFRFLKHDFVMIYRIVDGCVVVDGMFHELQDYESTFITEMGL